MFSVAPSSTPWLRCVNRQLVCLPPVVIFKHFVFIWNICFSILPGPQCKLLGPLVLVVAIKVYLFTYLFIFMYCTQHQVAPIFTFIAIHESAHAHNELRAFSTTNSAVIYQILGRVFHPISKHREVVEKNRRSRVFFLTNLKVFGYRMKHPFECLI